MNIIKTIEYLEKKHQMQHKRVDALEAEKVPEEILKRAKIEKLNLKTELERLKGSIKNEVDVGVRDSIKRRSGSG